MIYFTKSAGSPVESVCPHYTLKNQSRLIYRPGSAPGPRGQLITYHTTSCTEKTTNRLRSKASQAI